MKDKLAMCLGAMYVVLVTAGAGMMTYSLSQIEVPAVMEVGSGMPPPPDCWVYYDNEQHRQWAMCMGVPYMDKGYDE